MIYNIVIVLIFVVCVLLILIVLVQNSKGGGLTSSFASSGQIMGVRRTADFLEKATWYLAGALLVFSVVASMTIPRETVDPNKSKIEDQVNTMPGAKTDVPNMPAAGAGQNQPVK
jgi:preprotein translocase subunit SecG